MDSLTIPAISTELTPIQIIAGSVTVRPTLVIRLEEPVVVLITPAIKILSVYFGETQFLRLLCIPQTYEFRGPPRRVRVMLPLICPPLTSNFRQATESPSVFLLLQPHSHTSITERV